MSVSCTELQQVTACASDSMFLCIDFVRIKNCYDYDYNVIVNITIINVENDNKFIWQITITRNWVSSKLNFSNIIILSKK